VAKTLIFHGFGGLFMYGAWKVDIAIPATSWLTLPFGSFLGSCAIYKVGHQPVVNGVYNPYKYRLPI